MDDPHKSLAGDDDSAWPAVDGGDATEAAPETGYPIGVVARLTGIQPSTLRMWERRYRLVEPQRSDGGNRRYSDDDIQRLVLLKALVDAGHQISTIAPMSIDALEARLERMSVRSSGHSTVAARPCRVLVVGSALPERLRTDPARMRELEVVASLREEQALAEGGTALAPDVLVVEYASVHGDAAGKLRQMLAASGASHAVVVYGFASRQALSELEGLGAVCLRAPVDVPELVRACLSFGAAGAPNSLAEAPAGAIRPPRFSPEQLARISARAPVIACECPHHLVDLINSMAAFEAYSRECRNRNAEDARIHAMLAETAGRSRTLLEEALQRVAEFEGIELD